MDTDGKMLLSIEEAAHKLDLAHSTVRAMLASGEIGSLKIGKRRLVPVESLTKYVDALMAEQGVEIQTQAVH